MVLAPYAIAAPLVFAANLDNRITLGTLIKMSNSFEKVFASLSVVAENWGAINDFRSTYRRLREFEQKLYPPVATFGWRRPRVGTAVSRSNSGTATTQLTEVRPRGDTDPRGAGRAPASRGAIPKLRPRHRRAAQRNGQRASAPRVRDASLRLGMRVRAPQT